MWTATVLSKQFVNGLLTVMVNYTNGVENFNETHTTTSPENDWLNDIIKRKIEGLNKCDSAFNIITLGEFEIIKDKSHSPEWINYRDNIERLNTYTNLIRKGIMMESDAKFNELKTWLTDNFKDEYVDMF